LVQKTNLRYVSFGIWLLHLQMTQPVKRLLQKFRARTISWRLVLLCQAEQLHVIGDLYGAQISINAW